MEHLRVPPPPRRRLRLLAEPRRGIKGGRRSSLWGGERERLMEDKAGVAIIYKDRAKTFRLLRTRPKNFAILRCESQTVSNKNRL